MQTVAVCFGNQCVRSDQIEVDIRSSGYLPDFMVWPLIGENVFQPDSDG